MDIRIKIVKHLLKCYFQHILIILVASNRQTHRLQSSIHLLFPGIGSIERPLRFLSAIPLQCDCLVTGLQIEHLGLSFVNSRISSCRYGTNFRTVHASNRDILGIRTHSLVNSHPSKPASKQKSILTFFLNVESNFTIALVLKLVAVG